MPRRLCEIDREIIRRAPEGVAFILAERFGVSVHYVEKIRNGARGLPLPNGLGARPHLLRTRKELEKWHDLAHTRDNGEAVNARSAIAARITPAQIADAQRLTREWKRIN